MRASRLRLQVLILEQPVAFVAANTGPGAGNLRVEHSADGDRQGFGGMQKRRVVDWMEPQLQAPTKASERAANCTVHSAYHLQTSGPLSNPQQPWLARSRRPASPPVARRPASRCVLATWQTFCKSVSCAVWPACCAGPCRTSHTVASAEVLPFSPADAVHFSSFRSSRRRQLASPRPLPVSHGTYFTGDWRSLLLWQATTGMLRETSNGRLCDATKPHVTLPDLQAV